MKKKMPSGMQEVMLCRSMKRKHGTNDPGMKHGTNDPGMTECINELINEDASLDPSSEWMKLASCGGLLHIKNTTYDVFHSMELISVHIHLAAGSAAVQIDYISMS